jgi:O-acetyl-ADP-ribose deacetylase (regulator of RNase III)
MIEVVQADITALNVDAIVNAANRSLAGGGGVDGAIHRGAGPALAAAAVPLGPCATGDAVITPGFGLQARFVIHAVGPIWTGGARGEPELLRRAYERSFQIAREQVTIRSIAFPAISTGAYCFPRPLAAEIALGVMQAHEEDFERILACLFDDENAALYSRMASVTAERPKPL